MTGSSSTRKHTELVPGSRVLLIGPTHPFRGGIAHHTTLLYRALAERYDTTFVSFRRQYFAWMYPGASDRDRASEAAITAEGVRYELDVAWPHTFVRWGRRAAQFDAVVLPWWVAVWAPWYGIFLAALRGRSPVVLVCHNVTEHESHPVKRALTRAVLRRADGIVAQSRAEADQVADMIEGDVPVRVAPHPRYDVFDAGRFDRRSARAELDVPADAELLLFFGFVRPYKGLDSLLEAFALVARSRPQALLLVVGECWSDEDRYRAMAERIGSERCRLQFRYVANEAVEAYVKAADAVVLPYLSGTGSGIAQIALAMDTPVVATEIAAFEDVIVPEMTGLLVPPGDPAALAAAIERILEPDRQSRMRSAIAADKQRFSWSALVDHIAAAAAGQAEERRP